MTKTAKTTKMTANEFAEIVVHGLADFTVDDRRRWGVDLYNKEDADWRIHLVSTDRKFKAEAKTPNVRTDRRTHEAAIVMDDENKRLFMLGFKDESGKLDIESESPLCMPWLGEKSSFRVDHKAAGEITDIRIRACDIFYTDFNDTNAYDLGRMWARRNMEKIMAA